MKWGLLTWATVLFPTILGAGPALAERLEIQPRGSEWRFVGDSVMGGVSEGTLRHETVVGRPAARLTGVVSLENNGGFIQITLDLDTHELLDASDWDGLEIDVFGNGEQYNLHLRTDAVRRPWQSYRQSFSATRTWQRIRLPFAGFAPHRVETPLDTRKLVRLGIVAIGRRFEADIAIGGVWLYRD